MAVIEKVAQTCIAPPSVIRQPPLCTDFVLLSLKKGRRMANLAFFAMCDSINNLQSGEMSVPMLVAPQIALRPRFIPGQFSFGIAFGFRDVELNQQNEFRFTIRQPAGDTVYDSGSMPLPLAPEDTTLPAQYQGFSLCCDIRNIEIPCEGEYMIDFHLNGDSIGKASLPIFSRGNQ